METVKGRWYVMKEGKILMAYQDVQGKMVHGMQIFVSTLKILFEGTTDTSLSQTHHSHLVCKRLKDG